MHIYAKPRGERGGEAVFPGIVPVFWKKAFVFFQKACVFFQKAAPLELHIYAFSDGAKLLLTNRQWWQ